jgi:transcriptional regulator with GAF, ATPase, and Fis domain
LQHAIEVAHEVGALNKAGLAALTLVEEVDLDDKILHAAYQKAHEWLADSQSQQLLIRVNDAARKLALRVCEKVSKEDAIDVLLKKPGGLESKILEYENALIKQALIQSNGAVTHAASLLGMTYQGLAYVIETRHKDLLSARSPVRRRPRKLVTKK